MLCEGKQTHTDSLKITISSACGLRILFISFPLRQQSLMLPVINKPAKHTEAPHEVVQIEPEIFKLHLERNVFQFLSVLATAVTLNKL